MGTSGAFKGSAGADAGSLRDSISSWLDDASTMSDATEVPPAVRNRRPRVTPRIQEHFQQV